MTKMDYLNYISANDFVSKSGYASVEVALKRANEVQEANFLKKAMGIPMKNAMIAWILNLLFGMFGAARFYIGDEKRAIIYLVCTLLGYGFLNILYIISFVFWVIDIFLIIKDTKRLNAEKIISEINSSFRGINQKMQYY